MGQNSSMMNRITLQLENAIVKLEQHAVTLKEVANLKKETFQTLITELNKAVAGITDSKGCRLQFNLVAGTMEGHNWKSAVRVDCWKIDAMTSSVSSQCRFTLRQFQKLYDELMFLAAKATSCTADSHRLKYTDSRSIEVSNSTSISSNRGGVGESTDDDTEAGPADELCSLCQECTTDVTLSCGHCFCQACLDKWLHVTEKKQAADAHSQQGGDCPLCKPTKEYEALLRTRAARGGAPLRVRVSPEMADELMSIPERIHAEFSEKRGRNSSQRADAAPASGIQRLVPMRSDDMNGSDDDMDEDCAGAAKKDSSAMSRAKQLLNFGRPETNDRDNLLTSSPYTSLTHGHDRK